MYYNYMEEGPTEEDLIDLMCPDFVDDAVKVLKIKLSEGYTFTKAWNYVKKAIRKELLIGYTFDVELFSGEKRISGTIRGTAEEVKNKNSKKKHIKINFHVKGKYLYDNYDSYDSYNIYVSENYKGPKIAQNSFLLTSAKFDKCHFTKELDTILSHELKL